jgi:hypothetical protein
VTGTAIQPPVPDELIRSVVNLVRTGPVPLGGYTLAEIAAVNGVIAFLERQPPAELVAEAVRSLAARNLITTTADDEHVQVRGDLGIALAFQQRSRLVLDARVTGTKPDEPWRFLLMPQPERVTLEVLIDALGIHLYALRTDEQALERLMKRLPEGAPGPRDADADAVLARSPHTALLTATRWPDDQPGESTDVVLAHDDGRLHVFMRDPDEGARLVAQGLDGDALRELVATLARA